MSSPRRLCHPGSSPLSRGILMKLARRKVSPRIIPALAGNTLQQVAERGIPMDHPRSRGEYITLALPSWVHDGSSPLSRGIPPPTSIYGCSPRIIPALAGNTRKEPDNRRISWDHPRSRGEYFGIEARQGFGEGSSPLSRGIPALEVEEEGDERIIPALAGNTGQSISYRCPSMGSSPLSRGIRAALLCRPEAIGIIPALAENTARRRGWRFRGPDHPRSRGEYGFGIPYPDSKPGSSPLSRGIPELVAVAECAGGIIPALAGNTPSPGFGGIGVTDHPRSRGEYINS